MKNKRWVSIDKILSYVLILAIGLVFGYQISQHDGRLPLTSWQIPFLKNNDEAVAYKLTNTLQPSKYKTVNFDTFWQVWQLLEEKYLEVDDFDYAKMVDGAVAGMVTALGDPYTAYLPATSKKISEEDLSGSFGGIGVELGYKDKILAIMAPISDGPADKLGVQAGDLIMRVKDEAAGVDEDTYDWTLEKAQSILRGKKGTKVKVSLYRENYNENKTFDLDIIRDEIVIKSVELEFINQENDQQIALLTLSRFGERTADEWTAAVKQILAQKNQVSGIILDLRNNPGGFLSEAIHIASEFIPKGTVVVQQGRSGSQNYEATGKGTLYNIPLTVLVNGGSASSSEIVAGALRDRLKAKLIGEKTFGKGLVQERIDLKNGAGLNVTIAKWMTPGGGWIQEDGLTPDLEVKDDPETPVDEAVEMAIKNF